MSDPHIIGWGHTPFGKHDQVDLEQLFRDAVHPALARAGVEAQDIDGIPVNNTAVFNVLQEHGMLQPTPEGKAIWKATVTSDTGWSHSFTLLRLAPALIWEANERPAPFAGTVVIEEAVADEPASLEAPEPASSSASHPTTTEPAPTTPTPAIIADTMDELIALMVPSPAPTTEELSAAPITPSAPADDTQPPSHEAEPLLTLTQPNTQITPSAEHFMTWLKHALATRKLILNDAKALVHTVDNTAFLVSPGIFQRYAQEHPQTATLAKSEGQQDWQWLQKRFEKLGLHRKQPNGLNIWTCEVTGPRKSRRLHGYLLNNPDGLFGDTPASNPYLSLPENNLSTP